MLIPSNPDNEPHLYRHIANYIIKQVDSGELPAGYQLPTVRALAAENGISQGTAKHAYDFLESLGYIQKTQGRGTFVCSMEGPGTASRKQDALRAMDNLLDIAQELGFSPEETRVIFDLKLRERETRSANVRLGAVECCPEALATMGSQISEFPHVDVYELLLDSITKSDGGLSSDFDLLVTTPTHSDSVAGALPSPPGIPIFKLVMSMTKRTLLELARIPAGCRVGVLCQSRRFSEIIARTCTGYGILNSPPQSAFFGGKDEITRLLTDSGRIILPQNYRRFASPEELEKIHALTARTPPILFGYQVEKGSLVFLEEQIKNIFAKKQTS